ncbi:MAG: long-chain-fatty-acid--CoA ligase [Hydrogenophaga sp.]|uniref:long-chain-fatty-acid--CoA ligase n=1 Tax=Hydrogenophaga sp. TaxID=1904254 RepID=UPI00272286EE|nr:long-chain-fatty-acid--CoA ligase [Hydrogenophaga sp.]MDO9146855.1 long-chain-fatty-acid--CoA ligase [Hydrogenophaga sp.]MDO9605864.1 long-chain-fatty-acid--CoA ligase [Hydrogenophaga sp.]MDP2164137.1 long-chain-fatty-acid--CoA ligase [Hydrogenophaga sp.]MDP3477914.1 long-chain-fatty-acid--CoA ligase [Hydrogenophaga sp.]
MKPEYTDISDMLAHWAKQQPDAPAIVFGDTRRTWSQLRERVQRVVAGLRAAGLQPGDRIAVLDLNHPSCLELTLACALSGCANAVVNFRLAPPEIAYVINDAQARLLFVGPEFAAAAAQLRAQLPKLERVIHIGGDADGYERWLDAHAPDTRVHPTAGTDCFLQLYTSGTTGFPKGTMLTHRGMLAHARNVASSQALDGESRVQVAMPLFHVGGTGYAFLALAGGAPIFLMRQPDPLGALQMLERERITHTFYVPALMAAMTQVASGHRFDFAALRTVTYGASPMPLPVMRACLQLFPKGTLQQVYGMTEQSGVVTILPSEDHENPAAAHRLVSAGKAIHSVEIEVRDLGTGQPAPVGQPGEIWVRSEQVMAGYWGKPEASAQAITPDGWYRSGDGGHIDADGYVYVTDRIKDMIISGGENIYPAEIERVLAEHPALQDVAVIGVPDERWGEVPKAVVVLKPGATLADPNELLAWCRERLAHFKCPKTVDVVAELPRNPTGKVLKRTLRQPYWEGRERQVA